MPEQRQRIIASIGGACGAELVCLPLSVWKTRYQCLDPLGPGASAGASWNRGWLVKCIPVQILAQVVSNSSKYSLYYSFRERLQPELAGVCTGVVSGIVCHPFDHIKTRLLREAQVPKFRELYSGLGHTVARSASLSALLYPIYEYLNSRLDSPVLAGALTSLCVTVIIHPLDLWRTQKLGNSTALGKREWYRGLSINLLRTVPHFAVSMWLTESLLSRNLIQ